MSLKILLTSIIVLLSTLLFSQNFDEYFEDAALRLDYYHSGNSESEWFSNDELIKEKYWGGSKVNLVDTFNYGKYKFTVSDKESGKLIYSRGYSTLFGEWTHTAEAKKINRSFSESLIMPFPKNKVIIDFYKRQIKDNKFKKVYSFQVDPKDYRIRKDEKISQKAFKIHDSGDYHKKLDIVILAEGYTQSEIQKFMQDANRFANHLFENNPFDTLSDRINIWAVPVVSEESGTDIPGKDVWKNTVFNSHFYTFGTERYLNTLDNKTVRDAAANAPYDQIYILTNTDKYGGAGIYNYYSICTSDNIKSEFVFVHEFGHAFAGLGDEYYTSDVAVEDFYNLEVEPWNPNLTTLVNFSSKWKNMVDEDTPIPTPLEGYDNKIGAFEGGGYIKKGIYRPVKDCSMKSTIENKYCPVCRKAFVDMVMFYTK